jgi:hypothetical protein
MSHFSPNLKKYNCSFYLPINLVDENGEYKGPKDEEISGEKWFMEHKPNEWGKFPETTDKRLKKLQEAWHYMLPLLREVIFPSTGKEDDGITQWELKLDGPCKVTLEKSGLSANITHVLLHQFYKKLFLLEIHVEMPSNSSVKSIKDWSFFTEQFSLIYFYYPEKHPTVINLEYNKEKITNETAEKGFSQIIKKLIEGFFDKEEYILKTRKSLRHNKMFMNASYTLDIDEYDFHVQKDDSDFDKLFSKLLYTKYYPSQDVSYVYDKAYTKELMKKQTLRKFRHNGIIMGFTNERNVYIFVDNGMSKNLEKSVAYNYARMLMLALFYRETLYGFDQEISSATKEIARHSSEVTDISQGIEKFRELRRKFILFTNNYWFHEVTSERQGIEIFKLQTQNLGLEDHYAQIKDEMERADEFLETSRNIAFDERTDQFSGIAALFAITSLIMVLPTLSGGKIVIGILFLLISGGFVWIRFKLCSDASGKRVTCSNCIKDNLGEILTFIAVLIIVTLVLTTPWLHDGISTTPTPLNPTDTSSTTQTDTSGAWSPWFPSISSFLIILFLFSCYKFKNSRLCKKINKIFHDISGRIKGVINP